ncbi:putative NAD binding Rossmann fold oxidoreductase [Dactylonectria macrodidyma]|uniref:NAD binding Rossmann fold oxidoreductase n=1 Tax=Dactylonectria macrodidyma TaxID=307937 RepID=A0A9P9FVS3_9HYPO|nr:putative NAD binding Rossmann fold oxidoreductase [Dactylonectria macrodidyma]
MSDKVFNVAVVGYGLSAKVFHIPFIKRTAQFKLHGIVQRTPKEGDSAPHDHPDIKHYRDFVDAVIDPEVDVVVLSTTPNTHFHMTKTALEAGKHVLTEKPFVPTSKEAGQLDEIAKKQQRILCVYQNRRWDSDFLTLKHILSQGTLGRLVEFNTHFDRYRAAGYSSESWKGSLGINDGGGVLYDLGTHLIDQVYSLFGLPQAVHGRLVSQRQGKLDIDDPDSLSAELVYPNGMLVNIRAGVLSAESRQVRYWIRGSKGSFHKYNLDKQEPQLKDGMSPEDPAFGVDDPKDLSLTVVGDNGDFRAEAVPELTPEGYQTFYNKFAAAVASGKQEDTPVKAAEAREVLRIIEAIRESAKTGKDVFFD